MGVHNYRWGLKYSAHSTLHTLYHLDPKLRCPCVCAYAREVAVFAARASDCTSLTYPCHVRKPKCEESHSYALSFPQTVGLSQAFWPLWELDEVGEDWWWGAALPLRLALAATTGTLLYGLATVSPGKGAHHPLHTTHISRYRPAPLLLLGWSNILIHRSRELHEVIGPRETALSRLSIRGPNR